MDRLKLSHIDEELDSGEVAALCFLCSEVVNRKRLEGIGDAKGLFLRLEEKGLLDNDFFLSELLRTIRRVDLFKHLGTDSGQPEETDAHPILSRYRVMLYEIYDDMTEENLDKMKFLLSTKLQKRKIETSTTALDLFVEMEKTGLLSDTNLHELHAVLKQMDQQLALTVHNYMQRPTQRPQTLPTRVSINQRVNNTHQPTSLPISETEPSYQGERLYSDAQPNTKPSPALDEKEYYALTHMPRGLCVVINNENFPGTSLGRRGGTQEDEKALSRVFTQLGFHMKIYNDLTAANMLHELTELSQRDFLNEDALVVCVLSHGEKGCVFGTDAEPVNLRDLTQLFTSARAPTLATKPKLFFIQACQGSGYQKGALPCPPRPRQEEDEVSNLEEDAGPVRSEKVAWDADFLLGMATVQEYKSFRNTSTGSIYIQELCRQLMDSANSSENDDILSVLTRVNREVSQGEYLNSKQMPEPKYTLTKKLVLKCVR